ncbi:MAG: PDDEXK nuclease domain-containing protein [Planctomycetaceae bacterium]|nr:PDDEXK nuclease domain-containing protein [Planctomycetaceae bacterium]
MRSPKKVPPPKTSTPQDVSRKPPATLLDYAGLLGQVKDRIRHAQVRAMLSVNAELIRLYWDIGRILEDQQQREGYGTAVIPRLARDLRNELPEVKGFSERNISRMIAFFRAYPRPFELLPQAVAKPPSPPEVPQPVAKPETGDSLLWSVPWGHHAVLIEKVKVLDHRLWYLRQTLQHGWSRNVLLVMIESDAHARQGKAIHNFADQLPPLQSDLVAQTLKDPYLFDFLTLEEPFHERELETGLLQHLERFLLELGQGFAFVGRQYPLTVGQEDYHVDLLFYHLGLRCFLIIDLKTGKFEAEHAGKMNFYLNVVDDQLRHPSDAPSIGLILCQDRNQVVAEYALRGMNKPIGISEYELTRALPRELQSSLPTIEAIEAELAEAAPQKPAAKRLTPQRKRRQP